MMTSINDNNNSEISMDTDIARVVVERGLATQQEVDRCISRQQAGSAADLSSATSILADTLIADGAITASQLGRVKLDIEETRSDRQIPNYQILSKLGSGSMATTFKARQLNLDRLVAIKILHPRLSENADYVDRFYKEGKAAATLNHPNIAQAFDVGESKGWHYFVMEYVEGHTLYDEIAGGKIFTESEAMDVILQIARALEHAHSLGLIHRDVKPKNIMMNEGVAKLVDMGLARQITDDATARAEAGRAFGTPYYISPEQIRGQLDIDSRADIYSLGATLYHMITGRVPFEAQTPTAVMHKHLKEPLVPPDHINESLSSGLGEVVEVMMAKDRNRRYSTATDLIIDLEAIAAGTSPLQARKKIDSNVLAGLADGSDSGNDDTIEIASIDEAATRAMLPYIILLAGALGISILFNILLLMKK